MAPPFIFPPNLYSLEEEDSDSNCLSVQNPTSLSNLRPSELEEFVKGLFFSVLGFQLKGQFSIIYNFFLNLPIACSSIFHNGFFFFCRIRQLGSHSFSISATGFLFFFDFFYLVL